MGLLVGVARELDLRGKNNEKLSEFDSQNYPHRPDTVELKRRLLKLLSPIEDIAPADIALFNIDGAPQHMGIISDHANGLGLIHAYAPARAVVEHSLDNYWREKMVGVFRLTSFSA